MVTRDSVIRVRVTEQEKEEIRDFIETELHHSGFSDYFRSISYAHMRGELKGGGEIDTGDLVDEIVDEMEPVKERMVNIEGEIDKMSEVILTDDDEIIELGVEVYELLPNQDEIDDFDRVDGVVMNRSMLSPSSDVSEYKSVSDTESWAEWFDVSVSRMERALGYVKREYPDVGVITHQSKNGGVTETVKQYYRGQMDRGQMDRGE